MRTGDKAIITRSSVGNEGHIVVVLDTFPEREVKMYGHRFMANCVIQSLGSLLRTSSNSAYAAIPYFVEWLKRLPELPEEQRQEVANGH
jgi:hypothetical protein